jgi:hypothetical protein
VEVSGVSFSSVSLPSLERPAILMPRCSESAQSHTFVFFVVELLRPM